MITGALAGFAAAHATGSPLVGFVAGAVAGAALTLIFVPVFFVLITRLFSRKRATQEAKAT